MITRVTILAYHAVGTCPREKDPYDLYVPTQRFAEQMSFLAQRRTVIPLSALYEEQHPIADKPLVVITFDDAYRCLLTEALPILDRYGFPSTVFVPTRWMGQENGWLEQSPCDFRIMSLDELKGAMLQGMQPESHGHAHLDFSENTKEAIDNDLRISIELLGNGIGVKPRFFAYPFGKQSDIAREAVREAGFKAAFTIDAADRGTLAAGRVPITPWDGSRTFALKTTGYWLQIRRSMLGGVLAGTVSSIVRPRKNLIGRLPLLRRRRP